MLLIGWVSDTASHGTLADIPSYVSHYRSSTTSHPELVEFVSHFEEHFRAWKNALLQGNFDDSLAGRSLTDKKYFLGKIETEMETLVKALEHSLPLSQRKEIRAVSSFAPSMGVLAYLDRSVVLLSRSPG